MSTRPKDYDFTVVDVSSGLVQGGADTLDGAISFAAAIFAAGAAYSPKFLVKEGATIHAVFGHSDEDDRPDPPTIDSYSPTEVLFPGPDQQLVLTGSGFTLDSVIVWNGGDEPTSFVSESQVETGINVSTIGVEITIPVYVRNADGAISNAVTVALVAAPEEDGA
jgi:hypothetical protein